ncbi:GIY-YIG nuclease family protein [Desulfobacterales bacterium HSG16]|nr:GIY-YIG nuclease family protein [Desulfobacterales bacterium HSG16]
MKTWFLYILRCADGSLYTGITTDVKRRLKDHTGKKGAKYLRPGCRRPFKIVFVSHAGNDRSTALKFEYRIKSLHKRQKEKLITKFDNQRNYSFLDDPLDLD